jgi:hypothetical protein
VEPSKRQRFVDWEIDTLAGSRYFFRMGLEMNSDVPKIE